MAHDELDWRLMETRENTGILWSASKHIQGRDPDAAQILHSLRDDLIDNGDPNKKSIWLMNRAAQAAERM